jgi:hypothetical protein
MRSGAAYGGAGVAKSVVLLACPAGPVPLAARGLAAVLARAGPAGARGHQEAPAVSDTVHTPCHGPDAMHRD